MEIFEAFKKNTEQIVSATKLELDKKVSKLYTPDGTIQIENHQEGGVDVPGEYDIKVYNESIVVYANNAKEFNAGVKYINDINKDLEYHKSGIIYITGLVFMKELVDINNVPKADRQFTIEDWTNPQNNSIVKESVLNFTHKLDDITIEGYGPINSNGNVRFCVGKSVGSSPNVMYTIKGYKLTFNNMYFSQLSEKGQNPEYTSIDRTSKPLFMAQHNSSFESCYFAVCNKNVILNNAELYNGQRDILEMYGNFDEQAKTRGSFPNIKFSNCTFVSAGFGAEEYTNKSQDTIRIRLSNYTAGGGSDPDAYEVNVHVDNCNFKTTQKASSYNVLIIDSRRKNRNNSDKGEDKKESDINERVFNANKVRVKVMASHYKITTIVDTSHKTTETNIFEMYSSISALNYARFYGLETATPVKLLGINLNDEAVLYDYSQSQLSGESVANRRETIGDDASNSTYPTTLAVKQFVEDQTYDYATEADIESLFEEPYEEPLL